jgi:hypothetical protein
MKRWLFEIHRWVGIALALFMLLWFFSGLLIVFAEPTTPTRADQLAHGELFSAQSTWLSAGAAWEKSADQRKVLVTKQAAKSGKQKSADKQNSSLENGVVEARLVQQAGEPIWLLEDVKGQRFALSAITGELHQTTVEQALFIANNWGLGHSVRYVELIEKPAILRNQDGLKPFHRVAIEDGFGTELLISARTGEVLNTATQWQRGLYWAGNWVHLFRPLELTSWSESRSTILTWTGFSAVIAALTGLIIGWLRWRPGLFGKKTYSEGRVHPYRNFWFKWHFWGGLIGGIFALTWGVSGFLNGNPWDLFSPANTSKSELARYVGRAESSLIAQWRGESLPENVPVVEQVYRRLGQETVAFGLTRAGEYLAFSAQQKTTFDNDVLLAAAQRLAYKTPIATLTILNEYNSYYYLRHHRDVADRPLPVVKIALTDAAGTHLYLDPHDGRLLLKQDRSRRIFRWLYSALHHWDFGILYIHPLWDSWMVIWVLFGLTLSVTAVVVGTKRLFHSFNKKHSPVKKPHQSIAPLAETLVIETQ